MSGCSQLADGRSVANQPLRVALVTETYPPEINGVAMTLARLVAGLEANGNRVQVIRPRQQPADTAGSANPGNELLAPGLPLPRYPGLRVGLPIGGKLATHWNRRRPDVVHVATEGPLGWSALHTARRLGIPVTTGYHTNFHRYSRHYGLGILRRPIIDYLRKFHNASRATLVPTQSLRAELEHCGYRNLFVVARGVDTQLFNPARRDTDLRRSWGATESAPVAMYVGRLAPEKNLSLIVRTFETMRRVNPQSRMVWVGDGPQRKAMTRDLPQHLFAGARTGDDLAAHYASADIFLFASMTETFGNVVLEAMASGLAVVAYDYAAARQHIAHEVSGLLAPLGDEPAFARFGQSLAGSATAIEAIGSGARKAAERVAWQEIYDEFERILRCAAHSGATCLA